MACGLESTSARRVLSPGLSYFNVLLTRSDDHGNYSAAEGRQREKKGRERPGDTTCREQTKTQSPSLMEGSSASPLPPEGVCQARCVGGGYKVSSFRESQLSSVTAAERIVSLHFGSKLRFKRLN